MNKTRSKGSRKVVEGDNSRGRGRDVTRTLGAPFKVYADEASLYKNLLLRKVKRPVKVNYARWKGLANKGDKFAEQFVKYIDNLGLEKWATMRDSAYENLVREFYTSCSVSKEGVIECRINGEWKKFGEEEIEEIFGFSGCAKFHEEESAYDEKEFWDSLKVKGVEKTKGYPATAIQDNALYLAFRFVAQSLWGKGEPSQITIEERMALWKLKNLDDSSCNKRDNPVHVYPFVLATIKNALKIKKAKGLFLTLGGFITGLAKKEKWSPGNGDIEHAPREIAYGKRKLITRRQPKGKDVDVCELRDPDLDEDADFVPEEPSEESESEDEDGDDVENEAEEEENDNDNDNGPDLEENPRPAHRRRLMLPEPEIPNSGPVQPISDSARPESGPARQPPCAPMSTLHVVAYSGPSKADFDELKGIVVENHRVAMEEQGLIRAENASLRAENASLKAENAELRAEIAKIRADHTIGHRRARSLER